MQPPRSRLWHIVNTLEENLIALLLGLMAIVTFVNVIMRYIFNDSLIWGLELTLVLFAWLVLLGVSYAVKINAHLGVDALTNALPKGPRKWLALVAAALSIFYAVLLLKGAWDFFAPFIGADQTSGRWFPTGFVETRDRAWYETDQIPMPRLLGFLEGWINQGEPYEKLPRAVPYLVLPLGVALLLFRLVQATIDIAAGRREAIIVSHEAEDAVEDVRHLNEAD